MHSSDKLIIIDNFYRLSSVSCNEEATGLLKKGRTIQSKEEFDVNFQCEKQ